MATSSNNTRDLRPWLLLVSAAVIAVDRLTKLWVEKNIPLGPGKIIIPNVFRISHVLNTGAAFSMFADSSGNTVKMALIAFSAVVTLIILGMIYRVGRRPSLTSFGLALILGGAIGNLYDRIVYAHVVDFLAVRIVHYDWPDFNIADSAICIGAGLLLIEIFRPQSPLDNPPTDEPVL